MKTNQFPDQNKKIFQFDKKGGREAREART